VNAAQFLIDTSAPDRLLRGDADQYGWNQVVAAGLIATCPITDLRVAATAELQGLTLLHRDRDFECIASVTGQALQWYGPQAGK
jgi:predicted nucleic acid-binding protein